MGGWRREPVHHWKLGVSVSLRAYLKTMICSLNLGVWRTGQISVSEDNLKNFNNLNKTGLGSALREIVWNEDEQNSRSGGNYNVFLFRLHKDNFLYRGSKAENNLSQWLWSPWQVSFMFECSMVSLWIMGQYASERLLNEGWRHPCCPIGNGSPEQSYEINCSEEEVNKHRTSAGINLE